MRPTPTMLAAAALAVCAAVAIPLSAQERPVSAQAPEVPTPTADLPPTTVIAIVRGLRNDRGVVRGAIYPSRETFTHEGQGTATCIGRVRRGVARCVFENVPAGTYAIGMMHDEDEDDHFDQGFLGIPEEGYCFSRNARGTLGPPSFESASFRFDARRPMTQEMTIHYGI